MTDIKHYAYRVLWSAEDGEHVATVAEFPSLSWLDENQSEALRGLIDLVAEVVADLESTGEPIPQPISERRFSGKFNVRVPESLHRELVLAAAEQGVSLNRLVSDRLAHRGVPEVRHRP
ncbi:MAG: type II toxin-antitoxin system HicB family antitoxin [Acidimicrobiales bacterium]